MNKIDFSEMTSQQVHDDFLSRRKDYHRCKNCGAGFYLSIDMQADFKREGLNFTGKCFMCERAITIPAYEAENPVQLSLF